MAGILCHTQPGEKNICSRKTRSVSGKWHKDHRSCLIIANFTILLFPILFVSEKLWDQGKFHALYQLDLWKGRWMMLNVLILKINYNSVTFYQTPQIWAARKTHWAHINVYIHTYIYLCIMMYNIFFFVCEAFHPNSTNPYVISMFPLCQWWLQQYQVSWRYCSSLGAPCNPARGIWPHHIVRWWRWRITQFVPKKMPMVFRFKIMATRFFFGKKNAKKESMFFFVQ